MYGMAVCAKFLQILMFGHETNTFVHGLESQFILHINLIWKSVKEYLADLKLFKLNYC